MHLCKIKIEELYYTTVKMPMLALISIVTSYKISCPIFLNSFYNFSLPEVSLSKFITLTCL